MNNGYIKFAIFIGIALAIKWGYQLLLPKVKGVSGEKTLSLLLRRLPKDKYKVIDNIMLATEYGMTQIDHIVLSLYGIFIIETKNYTGQIIGNETSPKWTQNIYGNKKQFKNPIHQNYGHVKAVEALIENKMIPIIPMVAFPGDCTLKVNATSHVVLWGNVVPTIKKYQTEVMTANQMDELEAKIISANVDSKENRKQHVKQIQKKKADLRKNEKQYICPKCGGKLVKRKGKYGEFWGCENYPKCKYTMNRK